MAKGILKGPRLTLRPLVPKDALQITRWFNDKEVVRYFDWSSYKMSVGEERRDIVDAMRHPEKRRRWALVDEAGRFIGLTNLHVESHDKRAEWSILIGDKNEWGKGYAGEAFQLVATFAFKTLRLHRLELVVSMPSKNALRAYKKMGFKLEGIKRESEWNRITKKFDDVGVMSMLREEWLRKK